MKKITFLMAIIVILISLFGCSKVKEKETIEINNLPVEVSKFSLKLKRETSAEVALNFDASENAVVYEIYRKRIKKKGINSTEEFKIITKIKENNYIDTNVNYGDTYIYRVRAVREDGTKGDFSKQQKVRVIGGYSTKQLAVIKRMITEKGVNRGKITYTKKEIALLGEEILINKHNYLNDKFGGFKIRKATGLAYAPGRPQKEVSDYAYKQMKKMFNAAKKDGVTLWVYDIYRTLYQQTTYHNNKINYFKAMGYSNKDASVKASTITAIPNTSEHQSGLAIDIISPTGTVRDSSFAQSEAGKWLAKNSWKYGFVLRYMKNKTARTKIIFEPWHYRYVGKGLARLLYEEDICLEEYYDNIDKYNAKYVKYKNEFQ